MPTGKYERLKKIPLSEETHRLLEAIANLEERVANARAKDKARALVLAVVQKHGLEATDLREIAKQLGRTKGGEPVESKNLGNAQRRALGHRLKQARVAKGLSGAALVKLVGAKSTGAMSQWEKGNLPARPKYRAGLIKRLDLPDDFFDAVTPRPNGAHP